MKLLKHLVICEVFVLVFVLLIYLEFSFMVSGSVLNNTVANNQVIKSQETRERPLIKAEVSLNNQTLKIKEEITFVEPIKEVWLNNPANIYAKTQINKTYPKYNLEMLNDNVAIHASLPYAFNSISIDYEINLEKGRKILSYNGDNALLTEFLITPAPFVKERPLLSSKCSFGDPFVYNLHDYEIILKVDSEFTAFAPGQVSKEINGARSTYSFKTESVRDFPIALLKKPTIQNKNINDIKVTYVNMPEMHNDVTKAFNFIEEKVCKYPFKELFIIGAPIENQGMEFSQMFFISDILQKDRDNFKRVIQHEVFHQWIYNIIGTDQINEPFMDEGLVSFFVKELNGEEANSFYNNSLFDFSLFSYSNKSQYYKFVYNDGTSLFSYLHEKYNDEFYKTLNKVAKSYKGKILTYKDFINELNGLRQG